MAAVNRPMPLPNPDEPPRWEDRHRWIAHQLVRKVEAARPAPDCFVPRKGMPLGQDIQLTPGAYTYALIAPGEWPTDSETELEAAGEELTAHSRRTENAAVESYRLSTAVFNDSYTAGEGAEAAAAHYEKQHAALLRLSQAQAAVGTGFTTLGGDVRTIKRLIRDEHDTAHAEIERTLRAQATTLGGPVGVVAIVAKHRPLIAGLSAELRGHVATQTGALLKEFPETPAFDGDPRKGTGIGKDLPTDGSSGKKDDLNPPGTGTKKDLPTGGQSPAGSTQNGNGIGKALPSAGITSPASPSPSPGRPSLPSMPTGGGSGSSPLSGAATGGMGGPLSGLLGGGPSSVAGGVGNPASSVQGQAARAMQASMGGEFGRGLAAGANAAGAMPFSPTSQPVPQAPPSPLAAPMGGSAPSVAAPATTSAPIAPAGPPPAAMGSSVGTPAAGGPSGGLTPYGSVLPPTASGAGGPVASGAPGGLSGGSVAAGPAAGGGGPGATSFVPVSRGGNAPERVSRDVSLSDLEVARGVVADLAAASSVVHPGLDWAVGVARGTQGTPEYWIASNEGSGCYIPAGVYVPASMPVCGDLDDGHWAGWFNPAETVLRAIEAHGSTVSAIATTFMSRSRLIDEDRPLLKDVAVGVAPVGGPDDAEASRPLQSRSHRLETVAPGLFQELSAADPATVDAYARHVTGQAVFNAGPELSSMAQAVARGVVSGKHPGDEEWTALRQEYTSAVLMAGSQRPGLMGIHEPHQLLTYQREFAVCRRLEAVVCWEHDSPADVVYAAWQAGVQVPFDVLERV